MVSFFICQSAMSYIQFVNRDAKYHDLLLLRQYDYNIKKIMQCICHWIVNIFFIPKACIFCNLSFQASFHRLKNLPLVIV